MVRINLLPPEYRPQPQIKPLRLLTLLGLILAPVILAGAAAFFWYDLYTLDREIADLTAERAQYGPLYDRVMAMERQLAQVQEELAAREKLVADHLDAVEILTTLSRMVPKNVTIKSLTLAPGGGIDISATATDYYGVGAFQLRLTKSEEFAPAVLSSASGTKGTINFQLTTAFRKGGGAVAASTASSSVVQVQAPEGTPPPAPETGTTTTSSSPAHENGEAAGSTEGVVF